MRSTLLALLVIASVAAPARAAVFPPDSQWVPFHCGNQVMTDALADDPAFLKDLDVVGDLATPAGSHASDATNLYLRLRLDEDPAPNGVLKASAWGFEFDLDGDPATYELLVIVDGTGPGGAIVAIYANTTTTVANSPADPADAPPIVTYAFGANAQSVAAVGSLFGNTADYFLEIAVPWSVLAAHGLDHTTSVRVWAGSSSVGDALNGDLACHDGGTGAPTLDGTASTATPADPGSGSGGGPGGPGQLVGGERCSVGGGGGLACVVALAFACRRRRRSR